MEFVLLTLNTERPPGVERLVDVENEHNPASVTCIFKIPAPKFVNVLDLSKVIFVEPLDPE